MQLFIIFLTELKLNQIHTMFVGIFLTCKFGFCESALPFRPIVYAESNSASQ